LADGFFYCYILLIVELRGFVIGFGMLDCPAGTFLTELGFIMGFLNIYLL